MIEYYDDICHPFSDDPIITYAIVNNSKCYYINLNHPDCRWEKCNFPVPIELRKLTPLEIVLFGIPRLYVEVENGA